MNKRLNLRKAFKKNYALFLLSLPGLAFVAVVYYLPMFGIVLAFKDFDYAQGIWGSPWSGWDNFRFFFTSQDAFRVTRNTLLLNLLFIVVNMVAALLVAVMLYSLSRRLVKLFQTILFFPYFLSWVVVGFIAYVFLNPAAGVFNRLLALAGLPEVSWYADTKPWPALLTLFYVWKNVGYTAIIFYTGLLSLDKGYFEAAEMDGATQFQLVTRLAIPLISPLIVILTVLAIGKILYSDFGLFYFVPRNSGLLYPVTDVIDTYVYRGLKGGEMGMSAAVGFYQSIVGFLLVLATNFIVRRINPDNSIF